MDHRYQDTVLPNEAKTPDGPDPHHFSPVFGGGQTWVKPDLENPRASHLIARAEFEKAGRRIIYAKLDGASTLFEKSGYRQPFGRDK